jgi:hypothetical protein
LNIGDEREMSFRLDAIMRDALDDFASLPLKVSDPDWMRKLDDGIEETPAKRPRRAAK